MSRAPHRRVANPPPKPLLIFDADCHFCRRWVERWRETTADRVDYLSSQEVAKRFPEIPPGEFEKAVQLVDRNGDVFSGAEAVFRSLGHAPRRKWLARAYNYVPGFAAVTEAAYFVIARNRYLASTATRWLWGDDVRRPTYFNARRWFLRTLGLVYLIAFISAWVQIDGLIGEHGLTPAREMLSLLAGNGSSQSEIPLFSPTLCWLNTSSGMLHALCGLGTAAAALLTFGLVPVLALLVSFACYLSLLVPGEVFFSYQWDLLLLETGFVALFVAPLQWRLAPGQDAAVSKPGLFLVKFLLFKLMFMSGVVKLTTGDDAWWHFTALDYHYWTQPLPTVFAWFADQSPDWLKRFCVAATLFGEIVVPFFIWAPRRLRHAAAVLLIGLQIAIAITGNYCFFNLLTITLCLLLIDDSVWAPGREAARGALRRPNPIPATVLFLTLPLNLWLTYSALERQPKFSKPFLALYSWVEPFRIANGYGLFRVMTRERPEIVFEGSSDGVTWRPYEFRWKPGDLNRAPQWNAPHQPRLDWSMWFAALGSQCDGVAAELLAGAMLRNNPSVLRLLAANPFPDAPPQSVRATLYQYRFTKAGERKRTGAWWTRDDGTEYLRPVSLGDFH